MSAKQFHLLERVQQIEKIFHESTLSLQLLTNQQQQIYTILGGFTTKRLAQLFLSTTMALTVSVTPIMMASYERIPSKLGIVSVRASEYARFNESYLDEFLIMAGVPAEVLADMPLSDKEMLLRTFDFSRQETLSLAYQGVVAFESSTIENVLAPLFKPMEFFEVSDIAYLTEFLIERGVPTELVSEINLDVKNRMYSLLRHHPLAVFDSFSSESIIIEDTVAHNPLNRNILIQDLTLSVASWRADNATNILLVTPAFRWNSVGGNINNDTFAYMVRDTDWNVIPRSPLGDLNSHEMIATRTDGRRHYMRVPTQASWGGAGFNIRWNTTLSLWQQYSGSAVFFIAPNVANPRRDIIVSYAQDRTASGSVSYSFNLGPFSVTYAPADANINTQSRVLSF